MVLYIIYCRYFIVKIEIDPNLLVFYLGTVEGDHCDSNVIYV